MSPTSGHPSADDPFSSQAYTRRDVVTRATKITGAAFSIPALSALLAACGGDDDEAGGGGTATTTASNVDGARQAVDDARAVPKYESPGPRIDISGVKGETIFYLPLLMGVPIVQTWWRGVQDAAEAAGLKAINFDPKAQASEMVRGMEQAINTKVACIIIDSIESSALAQQIRRAKAAGIKVLVVNERNEDKGGPALDIVDGTVSLDYAGAGKLEADWVIADSGGDARVAILKLPNAPAHDDMEEQIRGELSKYCGGSCEVVAVEEVGASEWATRLPTLTRSIITRFPDLNYMIPVVDAMSLSMIPSIKQAGAADRIKISTFNGTPAVLKFVENDDVVGTDIGGANVWESWAYVDQALRVMTENEPVDQNVPLRLFDGENIGEIDIDETDQLSWYGTGEVINGYKQLWGVA